LAAIVVSTFFAGSGAVAFVSGSARIPPGAFDRAAAAPSTASLGAIASSCGRPCLSFDAPRCWNSARPESSHETASKYGVTP
jgi:hypothetical protein